MAKSNTDTELKPEDYQSKKTVDDITEGSWGRSDYNPPPQRNLGLRTGPYRTNVDEETYEDIEHGQKQRDESYLAGRPTGQRADRRSDTRGFKSETADVGPRQKHMDVGRTGAASKEPNRGDRSSPERVTPGRRLQVAQSEAQRKKELAALSPEERKKSPFQRLKEADEVADVKSEENRRRQKTRSNAKARAARAAKKATRGLDSINERLDALQRTISESQAVDKKPQINKALTAFAVQEMWKATYGANNDQARKTGQRTSVELSLIHI